VGVTAATEVKVPDIGDFKDVPIIEVHVQEGQAINADDPVITLESDKATMDVPSPEAGTVDKLLVKVGDKVSEGTPILRLHATEEGALTPPTSLLPQQEPTPAAAAPKAPPAPPSAPPGAPPQVGAAVGAVIPLSAADLGKVHASPSVRRVARELDVDLSRLKGTGEKSRITKDDVLAFLRGPAAPPAGAPAAPPTGAGIPEIPAQDFAKFGPIETKPLSRIKRISGPHLHRSWLNVPHVTQHDEADITELEAYRKELDTTAREKGYRVTLLSFLLKASVSALKQFPEFNSSLTPEKDALILKKYYHIGIAVDTPDGLVVPVLRDVDRKGITELSQEMGAISKRARDGKLQAAEMQGAGFTISSLGGIGGTGFTPIVNAPEVAILGVVRSKMAPVWSGNEFKPRLMLPISVSYDHRVIDGAMAARFARHLCHVLEDVRRLVL
jgi:pyruvate dehydrogenase E2 component (dihydrolipoyllysine-residue acetyltransferase)